MPTLSPGTIGLIFSFSLMSAVPFLITWFVKKKIRRLKRADYVRLNDFTTAKLCYLLPMLTMCLSGFMFYVSFVDLGGDFFLGFLGLFFGSLAVFLFILFLRIKVAITPNEVELNYWNKKEVIKFKNIQAVTIVSTYPTGYIKVYLASGSPNMIPIIFKNSAALYALLKHGPNCYVPN